MPRHDPVAADEALLNMTEAQSQHLRERMAPGRLDQIDAATADAVDIATLITPRAGETAYDRGRFNHAEIPAWVRLGALDAICRWEDGEATLCRHKPHPAVLKPVIVGAWRPATVVCPEPECALLLAETDWTKDNTCDGCGHVCQGNYFDDGIRPISITFGHVIYRIGVCKDCDKDFPRKGTPSEL